MKKTITIAESSVMDSGTSRALILTITRDILEAWCLQLSLLFHGLIPEVRLSCRDGLTVHIGIDTAKSGGERGTALFEGNVARITLNKTNAEYVLHFFLAYYRDEAAPVDHLDIELKGETGVVDLVLRLGDE